MTLGVLNSTGQVFIKTVPHLEFDFCDDQIWVAGRKDTGRAAIRITSDLVCMLTTMMLTWSLRQHAFATFFPCDVTFLVTIFLVLKVSYYTQLTFKMEQIPY